MGSTLSEVSATGFLLDTGESSSSQTSTGEIDDGAISGIVIGSIFGLGFLMYVAYWYYGKYIADKSLASREEEIVRRSSIEMSSRLSRSGRDGSTKNPMFNDVSERRKSRDDLRNSRISILAEGQAPTSIAPWRESMESTETDGNGYQHSSVAETVGNPMIFSDIIPDASMKGTGTRTSGLALDTPDSAKRSSTKRTSFLGSILPSFSTKGNDEIEGNQVVIERERATTNAKVELSQVTGNSRVLNVDRDATTTPRRTSSARYSLNATTSIRTPNTEMVSEKEDNIAEGGEEELEEKEGTEYDDKEEEGGQGAFRDVVSPPKDQEATSSNDVVVAEDVYEEL